LLDEFAIQKMSTPEAHDLNFLENLCGELTHCMIEIRAGKNSGKLDVHTIPMDR
jgi:hypothetical protein